MTANKKIKCHRTSVSTEFAATYGTSIKWIASVFRIERGEICAFDAGFSDRV